MASTDKTPKLGLNQWAAGDRVLRTDFNEDNGKIEAGIEATKALVEANRVAAAAAALAASNAVMKMASGQLSGDGTNNRNVVLGFRPKLVMLAIANGSSGVEFFNDTVMLCFPGNSQSYGNLRADNRYTVTDNGFCLTRAGYNENGRSFFYIAFG